MRRGIGVSRAVKSKQAKAAFQEKAKEINDVKIGHMQQMLDGFKTHLEEFAVKHKKQINEDPAFRQQFQTMCAKIGVDPLASSKGFWANILGVGDFYFALAVQIIHVCMATRESNGGLMDITDLVEYLNRVRSTNSAVKQKEISSDDVKRSIGKLQILGNGIRILEIGARKVIISVPTELSADHTSLMQAAEGTGFVTPSLIEQQVGWSKERVERAIKMLIVESMVWVDEQGVGDNGNSEVQYWFPSIFTRLSA